jgi:hypothetical protein
MTITTTHDPRGGGRPRLIFVRGDGHQTADGRPDFDLPPGTTVIGSGSGTDLQLAGLDAAHAEVRRTESDEYLLVKVGTSDETKVDGQRIEVAVLRTGNRLQLGDWELTFFREEFADHGRPYGGRQGGEGSHQRSQPKPRSRGSSAGGGSERTQGDPGEYF